MLAAYGESAMNMILKYQSPEYRDVDYKILMC